MICVDIWTVCRRKLRYGILLIAAGFGRVMQTQMFGGSVNRGQTRYFQHICPVVRIKEWTSSGWRQSQLNSLRRISWKLYFSDYWLVRLHWLRPQSRPDDGTLMESGLFREAGGILHIGTDFDWGGGVGWQLWRRPRSCVLRILLKM